MNFLSLVSTTRFRHFHNIVLRLSKKKKKKLKRRRRRRRRRRNQMKVL